MEKLNIIMVNYNGSADTLHCLESLRKSNNDYFSIRIILIDNNSEHEDTKKIESYLSEAPFHNLCVHFIKNSRNVGFAAANNIGLAFLKKNNFYSGYIWFLNNDTEISGALLQKMKDTLPAENQALYFEMRNFQNTFYNNGLNYISLLTGRYSETEKKKYVPYICGASIYVKATERLPLWNEAFFLYFEDADYSIQLRKLKFSFVQLQDAFYRHKISASSGKNQKAVIYRLESQIKFMRTHGKNYLVYVILKSLYLMSRFRFSELKVLLNKGGMLLHDRNSH